MRSSSTLKIEDNLSKLSEAQKNEIAIILKDSWREVMQNIPSRVFRLKEKFSQSQIEEFGKSVDDGNLVIRAFLDEWETMGRHGFPTICHLLKVCKDLKEFPKLVEYICEYILHENNPGLLDAFKADLESKNHHLDFDFKKHQEFDLTLMTNKDPTLVSFSYILDITQGFKERLGGGGFGHVFKGWLPNGSCLAVKALIPGKEDYNREKKKFERQISLFSGPNALEHRNILKLYGHSSQDQDLVIKHYINDHLNGFTKANRFLILECMEYDLEKVLNERICRPDGHWPKHPRAMLEIMIDIANGLNYLHFSSRQGVLVHGDIKPQNLLLSQDHVAKIADFDLLNKGIRGESGETKNLETENTCRTLFYAAPETLGSRAISPIAKSDVYSFGVVLLEVTIGRRVYNELLSYFDENIKDEPQTVLVEDFQNQGFSKEMALQLIDVISKCLCPYYADDPDANDADEDHNEFEKDPFLKHAALFIQSHGSDHTYRPESKTVLEILQDIAKLDF